MSAFIKNKNFNRVVKVPDPISSRGQESVGKHGSEVFSAVVSFWPVELVSQLLLQVRYCSYYQGTYS